MKFRKRIVSVAAAVAMVVSVVSMSVSSVSAALTLKDYVKKIPAGDTIVGIGIQGSNWTFRDAIGVEDSTVKGSIKGGSGQSVIQTYTGWAYMYDWGHKYGTDQNGNALKAEVDTVAPTGIYNTDGVVDKIAEIKDAAIDGTGTYSAAILGYDFKGALADQAKNDDNGRGLNQLYLSSNISYAKYNPTFSDIVVKFYDSEADYKAGTPTTTKNVGFNVTGVSDMNTTGYTECKITNNWTSSSADVTIPAAYGNKKDGALDAIGISGFSGTADKSAKCGWSGCDFLPSYGIEITFKVTVPDSIKTQSPSTSSLSSIIEEVNSILNGTNPDTVLADVQADPKNAEKDVEQLLKDAVAAAQAVYDANKNYKSASKNGDGMKAVQKLIDDAVAAVKKVMADLGILSWGELNGLIKEAEALKASAYSEESYNKVLAALEAAKALKTKFANKESVTQEEIDAASKALREAIDALEAPTPVPKTDTGYGYIQFADSDGTYQWYNDGIEYDNVTATTATVVTTDKGLGKSYTVSAKCAEKTKGLSDASIEIVGLIGEQSGAVVTIDSVSLDGTTQKLGGVPYTVASSTTNAYVPLYDATVTEIPDDAITDVDGECAADASPQALSQGSSAKYAALETEWQEIEVEFTVNWPETEDSSSTTDENPDTNGGIAVVASLVAIVGAGFFVTRRRKNRS